MGKGNLKNRPGAKVVQKLPLSEKPSLLMRGSKVGEAAWAAAEDEEHRISAFIRTNGGFENPGHSLLLNPQMLLRHASLNRQMLLRRASFLREVALALERLAQPPDFTCWLAMFLARLEQQGKPKPSKAQALERLSCALSPNASRSDALKQLRRAESYLGEKLPKARPGAKRKS
jgi:hypothetical protein